VKNQATALVEIAVELYEFGCAHTSAIGDPEDERVARPVARVLPIRTERYDASSPLPERDPVEGDFEPAPRAASDPLAGPLPSVR